MNPTRSLAPDLLRGETDPPRLVHCLDHLPRKRRKGVIERSDFLAFLAQNWIVVVNNSQGHRSVRLTSVIGPVQSGKPILCCSK